MSFRLARVLTTIAVLLLGAGSALAANPATVMQRGAPVALYGPGVSLDTKDTDFTALDNGFVVAWRGNPGENIKARLFDINRTVSEDTTAVIDVAADLLANDSDPGALSFSVKTVDGTSAKGAALTFDAGAGTITYDPTGAATLQALNTNQNTTDTFTYTIENTNGETAKSVVTISVLGLNEVY